MVDQQFLKTVPKTDLHVHLDGSIRLDTLIELAKEQRVYLPSYTEEGLRELVFKDQYANLVEYLQGFKYTAAVLQTPEALARVAYELAVDNFDENVFYFEARFAPQLHVNQQLDPEGVLKAVDHGLTRAKRERNQKPEVRSGQIPKHEFGIIVCAMRSIVPEASDFYRTIFAAHKYSSAREVCSFASLELARAAVKIRDEFGVPIVGFDLAGPEAGNPAVYHREAFDYAHRHFLKKTVHAGEAYGPESIFQAITECHADRIGHGTYLLDSSMIQDPSIEYRRRYVEALSQYIADRRITVEVCLTSNLQTNPSIVDLSSHPFLKLWKSGHSGSFCTDNRTVSNTTVTKELSLAVEAFKLRPRDVKNAIIYGFKRSFFPGGYMQKRRYVRKVIDYYDSIAEKFAANNDSDKDAHEE